MKSRWSILVLGVVIGGATVWLVAHVIAGPLAGHGSIHVYEGVTTAVNSEGTAIGFKAPGADPGYSVAGAQWSSDGGPWHEGGDTTQTCLVPLSAGQSLTLGVARVAATDTVPGFDAVVWYECHGSPSYQER